MWVFIRPRGGQDCYLLTCEIRGGAEYCPIHRFDGLDQLPVHRYDTWRGLKKRMADFANGASREDISTIRAEISGNIFRKTVAKRLRGGIEFCSFPGRVRARKSEHRPEQNFHIGKECASPRIFQRHFQLDG